MGGFLRRYTELPYLIHLLKTRQMTLLKPDTWDDKNDSHLIKVYREKKQMGSILALCFTEAPETYHHWKVFSGSTSGVCIDFDKDKLLEWAGEINGLHCGSVRYRTIKQLGKRSPKPDDLPFIKRQAFRDEKEFRLIYEDEKEGLSIQDFKINLGMITKVIFNPWIDKTVFKSVKLLLKGIEHCKSLEVIRTTLVDNAQWKRFGEGK